MIVPIGTIVITVATWLINKATPGWWAHHVEFRRCPAVTKLPDDMPDWKREIYIKQCVPPSKPAGDTP